MRRARLPVQSSGVLFIGILLIAVCLGVYIALARNAVFGCGKVHSEQLGFPDLLSSSVLVAWFVTVVIHGFGKDAQHAVNLRDVAHSAALSAGLVAGICGFLYYRGINPVQVFGLKQIALWRVPGTGILLFLAAYPLAMGAAALVQRWMGGNVESQEIVQFFENASRNSDRASVFWTIAFGSFVAPVAEEFIFRGTLMELQNAI